MSTSHQGPPFPTREQISKGPSLNHSYPIRASFHLGLVAVVLGGWPVHGQIWKLTNAPITNWTSVACSADGQTLVAASGGPVWSGVVGPIYISTNAGSTWNPTTAPLKSWNAVASSVKGDFLIAAEGGAPDGLIYTSTNGGNSWISNAASPVIVGSWKSLAGSADGTTLLAGNSWSVGESYGGETSVSANGGLSWDTAYASGYLTCAGCAAEGRMMVVGLDAADPAPLAISTNRGMTWQSAPVRGVYAVGCSADGARLLANSGRGTSLFTSADSGSTWTPITNSGVAGNVVAISADGRTMIAAASMLIVGGDSPVFVSHDSGVTWTSNSFEGLTWASVASSADGSKLVAVANGGGIYTLQTTPVPILETRTFGANSTFSWTVPSMNLVLQQSPTLAPGEWTPVTVTPVLNYTNVKYGVSIPRPDETRFYRLVSQ